MVLLSESNAESESELSPILANFAVNSVMRELGGKIVVSGIEGNNDEDEFMLTLLNEQVCVFFIFYSSFLYYLFFILLSLFLCFVFVSYRRYGIQSL